MERQKISSSSGCKGCLVYLLHVHIISGKLEIIILTLQLILFLFMPVRIYIVCVRGEVEKESF